MFTLVCYLPMREYQTLTDLIDEPYVIRMILLVQEKGKVIASDFLEITRSTRTTSDVAYGLEKFGVFKVDVVTSPRRTINISLTKKGKKVATHLRKVVDAFNETSDGDDS